MTSADKLLDIPGACAALGNIGRTTLFALLRDGEIRSVKIGTRRLIPAAEVAAFIERKSAATAERRSAPEITAETLAEASN